MPINTTKRMQWDRLMRNSIIDKRTGCFLYTGPETNTLYGKMAVRLPGRKNPTGVLTHVLSFNTFVRKIREGYETKHQCHRTHCWNPDHLAESHHDTNCRERSLPKVRRWLK